MVRLGFYRHNKGGLYFALGEFKHTETKEAMVPYFSLHNWARWDRPARMWFDLVKLSDGATVTRFTRVSLWYALTHL